MMELRLRSLVVLATVTASCICAASARSHHAYNANGHARHRRQGARLYHPGASLVPGGEGDGAWGPWGAPSACSRSCGGGVAYQQRICLDVQPDGTPNCQGGEKKYFSCNTQDCPEASRDFREEQCSEYDSQEFNGVFYRWEPYTKAPNPCELNCMPHNERFYYRHKHKVVDGTRCNQESLDVCVDGECLPVGCDLMLGSTAQEDKCRECRGNGTNCKTIEGVFDSDDIKQGYNDILLIPRGATNINIKELRQSNNYLAIRSQKGEYYLNGGYRIDFPRPLTFAGAIWNYDREPQGFSNADRLRCQGPTTEPVYLMLLYLDTNVGVQYDYSIPTSIAQSPDDQYAWVHDQFTPCSASCGGGYQLRNVSCASRQDLNPVEDSLCDEALRPLSNQSCATQACAARWSEGPWSACTEQCGEGGTQSRQVYCNKLVTQGLPSIVDDEECFQLLGPKPPIHQRCNQGLECPKWHVGPWMPCDKLCGEGKQRRSVRCFRKVDGKVEVLADDNCAEKKPEEAKSCFLHPCEGVDYVLSDWSGCDSCLSKVKTRTANCATQKGEIFPDSFCSYHPQPVLQEECDKSKLPACEVQWYASQWSTCSGLCGIGVQSRRVFCGLFDGETIQKVDNDRCNASAKYNDTSECEVPIEKCPAEWYSGPWSECSNTCGGGEQFRKVLCMRSNKTISIDECKEETVLDSSQTCNIHFCDEDETLPVEPGSTPPVTDLDYDYGDEDCDEDYEELSGDDSTEKPPVSAADTLETEDLMFSDSPGWRSDMPPSDLETGSGDYYTNPEYGDTGSGDDLFSTSPIYEDGDKVSTNDFTISTAITSQVKTDPTESPGTELTPSTSSDISIEGTISTDISTGTETEESLSSTTESSGSTVAGITETTDISTAGTEATLSESTTGTSGVTESQGTDSTGTGATVATDDVSSTTTGDLSTEENTSTKDLSTVDDLTTTEHISTGDTSTTDASQTDSSQTDSSTTVSSLTDSSTTDSSTTDSSTDDLTTETATTDDITTTDASTLEPSTDASTTDASTTDSSTIGESSTTESLTETTDVSITTDSTVTETDSSVTSSDSTVTSTETTAPTSDVTSTDDGVTSTEVTGSDATSFDLSTDITSTESDVTDSTAGTALTDSTTESATATEATSETVTDATGGTATTSSEASGTGSTEESSQATDEGSTTESSTETSSTDLSQTTETGGTTESGGTTEGTTETGGTTESGGTTGTEGTTETGVTTETGGTTESGGTTETAEYGGVSTEESATATTSEWGWTATVESIAKAPKKCKRRPRKSKPKCVKSQYGCCFDNKTAAKGPFDEGCPTPKTCNETKHGCCPDGVSPANGKGGKGCPVLPCNTTLFGCCQSDNKTAAQGNNEEGCPPPPPACLKSKYGCCADGKTEATGAKKAGCPETKAKTTPAPAKPDEGCTTSEFGCCGDNETAAAGQDGEGCPCNTTLHGCCPDGETAATGPNNKGCDTSCKQSAFGCCPDNETPAHGPYREGCCLTSPFGCCPDNIVPARGSNLEGCGCQWSPFGCCPDNVTAAKGYDNKGCDCKHTPHGCCPDRIVPAEGPNFEGCPCHTYQFGCCPDGSSAAKGPQGQGCRCSESEFGCCGDEKTAATGPDGAGCDCSSSKFGCCPDGQTDAKGEKFDGCTDAPQNRQAACSLEKDRGTCRNYTVRWFYDMDYGGCSRFWYGGCDGNDNSFQSQEECRDVCVEPREVKEVCNLPKVKGPCDGYYPNWYYDGSREQCLQFIYGGCLGNKNRYESRTDCQKQCEKPSEADRCNLPTDAGTCAGNFVRWSFNAETKQCSQFVWGGCEGNSNRFSSESACLQHCNTPGKLKEKCLLPREDGNGTKKHSKWSFDQEENRCMPFYYMGDGGNDNQFDSEDECVENCPQVVERDVCTLAAEVGDCADYRERWYYDSAELRCRQFYYGGCTGNDNNFNTERECSARCIDQLTTTAVTVTPTTPSTTPTTVAAVGPGAFSTDYCFLDADRGSCSGSDERWHYDSRQGHCNQFIYGGCGGNQNNFPTKEHCDYYCAGLQDVCQLPMAVGACDGSIPQWFYDASSDTCSQFAYGGCQGNGNRFNTREECEERCRANAGPTTTDQNAIVVAPPETGDRRLPEACYLPMKVGRCRSAISAWFYDSRTGSCQNFNYGGCEANENNFPSEEQCERHCGRFRGLEVCRYGKDVGVCNSESVEKVYFDIESRQCAEFSYGGCSSSPNRFSTIDECQSVCAPEQQRNETEPVDTGSICKLPVETGNCASDSSRRWFYSDDSGACVAFIYTGCGGNANNFNSYEACLLACGSEKTNEIEVDQPTEKPRADPCLPYKDHCARLRCPYGRTQSTLSDGCERCDCDEPCRVVACEEDEICVVEPYRDGESGEVKYRADCRLTNKEGNCPILNFEEEALVNRTSQCERRCNTDADCGGADKCCARGCEQDCLPPVVTTPASLTTPPSTNRKEGEQSPTVDEALTEPEVDAQEGNVATLRCVIYGNPPPTITWKRESIIIDGTTGRYRILTDGALQIVSVYRNDSGSYICIGENGVGPPIQKAINLVVNDPKTHSAGVMGNDNAVIVGTLNTPLALRCNVYGWPQPTVNWWRERTMLPLHSPQYELRKDRSLLIRSLALNNLGVYTCQAYNGVGKPSSWSVTVQAIRPVNSPDLISPYLVVAPAGPILITPKPVPATVATQAPTTEETTPFARVEPRFGDEKLPIRVYNVPVSTSINVETTTFAVGSDMTLPCEVDGYPVPRAHWEKDDGNILDSSNRVYISESYRLTVYRVTHADSGIYTCRAQNQYSSHYSSVKVNIEGIYVHPNCTDSPFLANCKLIVQHNFCRHNYYQKFCCRSCTLAGQLTTAVQRNSLSDNQI